MITQTRSLFLREYSSWLSVFGMSTISVQCPISGCEFSTGDVPEAIVVVLLNTHTTPSTTTVSRSSFGPKLDRPKVEGIFLEEWNLFEQRWKVFQPGSNINVEAAAPPAVPMCIRNTWRCADKN